VSIRRRRVRPDNATHGTLRYLAEAEKRKRGVLSLTDSYQRPTARGVKDATGKE